MPGLVLNTSHVLIQWGLIATFGVGTVLPPPYRWADEEGTLAQEPQHSSFRVCALNSLFPISPSRATACTGAIWPLPKSSQPEWAMHPTRGPVHAGEGCLLLCHVETSCRWACCLAMKQGKSGCCFTSELEVNFCNSRIHSFVHSVTTDYMPATAWY